MLVSIGDGRRQRRAAVSSTSSAVADDLGRPARQRVGLRSARYLPRIAGALLLLIVGWIVVALIRRALAKLLRAAGLDDAG